MINQDLSWVGHLDEQPDPFDVQEAFFQKEAWSLAMKALSRLPKERHAIRMLCETDKSQVEVAKWMKLSPTKLRNLERRALSRLRTFFAIQNADPNGRQWRQRKESEWSLALRQDRERTEQERTKFKEEARKQKEEEQAARRGEVLAAHRWKSFCWVWVGIAKAILRDLEATK